MPEFSGPSVTKTPFGLHARSPPTPGTSISSRDATTARWSASSASGSTVPSEERVVSTAWVASKTLSSGSTSRFDTAAAASSLAVAIRASRPALLLWFVATTVSDPKGTLTLSFAQTPRVYRFASRTSEVLICPGCGVYVASCIDTREGKRATLNVAGIAMQIAGEAAPVSYED